MIGERSFFRYFIALALTVPAWTAASAFERCGEAVPVTRALLDTIANHQAARLGVSDAVIAAQLEGGEGTVLFVRRGGRWRGYALAQAAGVEGVYRSRGGDIFVWAYEGLGDPPIAFTGFHAGAAPGRHFCTGFSVPPSLNKPEWRGEAFNFESFNLNAKGLGAVAGSARVERDGREQEWHFRYSTRDGGRRWSNPVRVRSNAAVPGVYSKVGTEDAALLADLRRQAR